MIAPFALTNLGFGTAFTGKGIRLEEHSGFSVQGLAPFHAHVDGDYLGQGTAFEVGISEQSLPFCFPPGS